MKSAALPVFSSQEWLSAKVLVSDTKENHSPPTARPLYHKATEHADYAGLDMQSHQGNIRVDKLHTNHNIYVYIYICIFMVVSIVMGVPQKRWMVYFMEQSNLKWMV